MRLRMTLAGDRTPELWRRFMPRRGEVRGRVEGRYISMSVRDPDPRGERPELLPLDEPFDRWAAAEVEADGEVPEGMQSHLRSGGRHAVFVHRGPASAAPRTWGHIFGTWLPGSEFEADDREHFEVLPEGYRPDDPEAKEEVWIPVRPRRREGGEPTGASGRVSRDPLLTTVPPLHPPSRRRLMLFRDSQVAALAWLALLAHLDVG